VGYTAALCFECSIIFVKWLSVVRLAVQYYILCRLLGRGNRLSWGSSSFSLALLENCNTVPQIMLPSISYEFVPIYFFIFIYAWYAPLCLFDAN
jgi:hypothetical protein